MYFVGIDLGTSAVKVLLLNDKGEVVGRASKEYPVFYPQPGWSEQNPEDWWRASLTALLEVTQQIDRTELAGISFGGQMHGLVILDAADQVIRPAILWNDGRTEQETRYLNEKIGRQNLIRYTGNIAFAGFTAPKLLWLKEHEPDHFAKINKIMLPKDYIQYRLSGVHATDYSDASGTLLLNVAEKRWSSQMIDICSIQKSMLPKLYESFDVTGNILPELAERYGFNPDCKIIAGAGDNAAAAVGTGTVGDNACTISLGTSGTLFISRSGFSVDADSALHSFAHADGAYHLMGVILSAAACNSWWMDRILNSRDYQEEQKNITGLGKNHVYFLPYLMGERSPHNDALARACFIGMTMDNTRADMLQAVLEGVAFAMCDSLEVARNLGVAIKSAKITGGGSKSKLWQTILANVLNLKLEIPESEEGPSLGGALLAAVGCGHYSSVREAAEKNVRIVGTVEPDSEIAVLYEEKYSVFKTLYPALKPLFPKL